MGNAFETLRGAYLAPWAAGGKCESLATRMAAMLEGAGVPDSPSFLIRPERTDVSPEHLPSQAGPLPSWLGS